MEDPILFWNDLTSKANKFDHTAPMKGAAQGGPTRSSRATAIVHLAMHDAFFGVAGGQALYLGTLAPAYGGSAGAKFQSAAVSMAAQTMLMALYPEQAPEFEAAARKIVALNDTDSVAAEFGRRVGLAMLTARSNDGADQAQQRAPYAYSTAKPHHRGDPLNSQPEPLGAFWGRVRPFAIQMAHQLAPYPALTTSAYKADHKEVLQKGGAANQKSTTRTVSETVQGLYWAYDGARNLGTPPRLYNDIVRRIAMDKVNTWAQNARLFALVNVAMGDAGIYAWHWKYVYDLWRPVIGIREFDANFGWDATAGIAIDLLCDPFWRPLGAPKTNDTAPGARAFTPPFPAYPSGHATFGAAVFEIVRLFYGVTDPDAVDNIAFDFVSEELDGQSTDNDGAVRTRHERRFASLAEAMYENSVSRVFLGVHWRFDGTSAHSVAEMLKKSGSQIDSIGGVPLGRAIATDIFKSGLVPSPATLVL